MKAHRRIPATLGVVLVLLLAACGQEPAATEEPADAVPSPAGTAAAAADAGAATPEAGNPLDAVYADLEGLEGEAWVERLAELAAAEEGDFTWYTSTTSTDSGPMAEAFTDRYGIDVSIYRASAEDILQRLLQEATAGYAGADVVNASATQMQILDREGLLVPFESPAKDEIVDVAAFETWAGLYLSVFAAQWNTDLISQPPETWEQVLTGYGGSQPLAMELSDWDWFATLVQEHFMAEEGMTEEEAVELFREAARNATIVSGHTNMVQLLTSGEFAVATSGYVHSGNELREAGAPLEWEPPVEPLIARPNGIGIYQATDRPATALLFVNFALGPAQEMLAEFGRTPANPTYGGIPEEYQLLTVNPDDLLDQRQKWADLYQEIMRLSGGPVVE